VESTGVTAAAGLPNGYATTPVVVNGVVYTQDLESNVDTDKIEWDDNLP